MSSSSTLALKDPLDLIKISLDQQVAIKLRDDRQISGKLQAFDQHLNLVLSKAEERIESTTTTSEEKAVKHFEMLFVRGDSVVLVSRVEC